MWKKNEAARLLKAFPCGEGGPAGPDEGQVCHSDPFTGNGGKVSPAGEAMQQKSAAPFQEQRFYLLHRSIRYQNRQLPAYQSAAVLPVSETLGG